MPAGGGLRNGRFRAAAARKPTYVQPGGQGALAPAGGGKRDARLGRQFSCQAVVQVIQNSLLSAEPSFGNFGPLRSAPELCHHVSLGRRCRGELASSAKAHAVQARRGADPPLT